MRDIITFGTAIQDLFLRFHANEINVQLQHDGTKNLVLPYGEKLVADAAHVEVGGGATNTASAYKLLGLESAAVVAVGKDEFGGHIVNELRQRGVDGRFIVQTSEAPTGFSVLLATRDGDRTALVYRGANDFLTFDKIPHSDDLLETRWFSISHLSGHAQGLLHEILTLKASKPELRIAWNPGSTQIHRGIAALHDLLAQTELLFLNREEAQQLANRRGSAEAPLLESLHAIAAKFLASGTKVVVITDGKNGAAAWTKTERFYAGILPTTVANTTGAGDAFMAGFVAGYDLSHGDISTGLAYGSANAAGVVRRFGAHNGLRSAAEIRAVLASHSAFLVRRKKY